MRGWVKLLLIMILLPILIGSIVLFVAGRPMAFEILERRTAARFPEVRWIRTDQLAAWQQDTAQPQPLLLNARTGPEYGISHLKGAIPVDPYRPSLNSLRDVPKDSAIVVYSSADALVHPYDRRWRYLVEGRYRAQAPEVKKHSAAP